METWQEVADQQAGVVTRRQLAERGVDRFRVRNQVAAGRWAVCTSRVVATTTGDLTREQCRWLGVLHGGQGALLGDLTAAEHAGLEHWQRDEVTVWVPRSAEVTMVPGFRFIRSRRPLEPLRAPGSGVPRARLEPALLRFASVQHSGRTTVGVLAAAVQQRLTTADRLLDWLGQMAPMRQSSVMRRALDEIAGGAQSSSELDVTRMCRTHGFQLPARQVERRDADDRRRFTDCEWTLPDGRVLVLEVDGAFHLEVGHWEDDLARHRALTAPDRVVVRCTSRELRAAPSRVAADLRRLGVPAGG